MFSDLDIIQTNTSYIYIFFLHIYKDFVSPCPRLCFVDSHTCFRSQRPSNSNASYINNDLNHKVMIGKPNAGAASQVPELLNRCTQGLYI